MNKSILSLLLIVITYVVSTGASYAYFSQNSLTKATPVPLPTKDVKGNVAFDDNLPKTEACPLNGAKFSKQQRSWWEKHRPLGIMIENHEEARPQSGMSKADVIYEAVAEGGITRFLTIFYCQDTNPVGPVRSARTYYLDFISEYGVSPLYAHVGGANTPGPANALGQIEDYGWAGYNDLNQFSIGFPTFWRDYDRMGHTVATEHTMYSSTTKLWDFAAKSRKLSHVDEDKVSWDEEFTPYSFKEDVETGKRPASQTAHVEIWEGYDAFAVDWSYDKATNSYKRNNGGKPHLDKNTGKQLMAKTVVIVYMAESSANDGYENNLHLLYRTKGSGKAIVLMDGKQTAATWKKNSREGRMILTDNSGSEIAFNRGLLWFQVLPLEGIVTVK